MVSLVLRSLFVYFGAAAALLWLADRFVLPVRRRVGFALVALPFLLAGKAMLTGAVLAPIDIAYGAYPLKALSAQVGIEGVRSPILADVILQDIPWQMGVREALAEGRLPLWNPYVLAGQPLLAIQQHGALHPATLLGLLLPPPTGWTLEMALKILIALLAAYLFFRELELGEGISLFGAAAWAFSDYLVFHLGWQLQPAAAPFPLLLLGLRRLARDPSAKSIGLTVAALLLIISAGHPETVLHAVAGAGIFFVFQLWWAGRRRWERPLLFAVAAGAIALGLSAFLLLPFREAVPHTVEYAIRTQVYAKSERSISVRRGLERSVKNVVPYAFGVSGRSAEDPFFVGPAGYGGSILLPLAILGLASSRREKWPLLIGGVVGLATWARLPPINDMVCRLPLFDIALNERLAFLTAFAVVAFATFGLERLTIEKEWPRLLAAVSICLVVLAVLFLHVQPGLRSLGLARRYQALYLGLQIVPLALLGLVATRRSRTALVVPAALTLVLAQRWGEVGTLYPTLPAASFAPRIRLLDGIPVGEPFRLVALGWAFLPNISMIYHLEDARGNEAMTFVPLFETFRFWCLYQPVAFNRVEDPTRPFLSFLNVRWVIAPPGFVPPLGWRVAADDETGRLLENPNVLARAFAPREYFREGDPAQQIVRLQSIADFRETGVVGEAGGDRVDNGEAEVRISRYEPEKLTLEIEAKAPTLVAASITRWPGWKVSVDGSPVPILPYNRAFIAFRVGAGHHKAHLAYEPDSVRTGLAISLTTLALCLGSGIVALLRNRRLLHRGARSKAEPAREAPPRA